VRELRPPGSVRGVFSNGHPYRDTNSPIMGFRARATEKDFQIPTQPERRERALRDLIRKRQKPIALFSAFLVVCVSTLRALARTG
jgi:hypothetical protein